MRLTYHRSSEFRTGMWILACLPLLDLPLVIGLAYLLPRPWGLVVGGVLVAGLAVAYPLLLSPWFTHHTWTSTALELRVGWRLRVRIPRAQIAGVGRSPQAVDLGIAGLALVYERAQDALVVSTRSRGLLALELAEPLTVKIPREGRRTVSRVLLGIDEPELLLRAWGEAAGATPRAAVDPAGGGGAAGRAATDGPGTVSPAVDVPNTGGLVATGLAKSYGGYQAVAAMHLTVRPGEIVALLGANGAGKSTTLQMMAGLLPPDAGQVLVDGHDVWADPMAARAAFSYVPDTALLHESLTAREFLWFLGDLYGLDPQVTRARTEALLARLGLTARADTWLRGYSLGMRRKTSLAAALLHEPRVLILDEVTNGLDPRANRDVLDMIQEAARGGASVLLATHVLPVVEEIAQRIAVMHGGRIRAMGTLAELRLASGLPGDATLEQVFLTLTAGGEAVCA